MCDINNKTLTRGGSAPSVRDPSMCNVGDVARVLR